MHKAELEKYYLETTYSVFIDAARFDCKVGDSAPEAVNDLLLTSRTAAIITACNPRSKPLSADENINRNKLLNEQLKKNNFTVLQALGQGKVQSWPAEESFFILGISQQQAEQLAIDYDQNAYVWFELKKPLKLIFSDIWNEIN